MVHGEAVGDKHKESHHGRTRWLIARLHQVASAAHLQSNLGQQVVINVKPLPTPTQSQGDGQHANLRAPERDVVGRCP